MEYHYSAYWVQVFLYRTHLLFDLLHYVVADDGAVFRDIFANTGVSVRLRGIGSGMGERMADGIVGEAPVPLMVMMVAGRRIPALFQDAVARLVRHLEAVGVQYEEFCRGHALPMPERHLFRFAEWSSSCEAFLIDTLAQYPGPDVTHARARPLQLVEQQGEEEQSDGSDDPETVMAAVSQFLRG